MTGTVPTGNLQDTRTVTDDRCPVNQYWNLFPVAAATHPQCPKILTDAVRTVRESDLVSNSWNG